MRHAWRQDDASAEVEKRVLEMFGSMLSAADHKTRMEQRFYADDVAAGLRASERLGGDQIAIGKARARRAARPAMPRRCSTPGAGLGAGDAGYIFARVQWLRLNNKPEEAGKLVLTAPKDPEAHWSTSIGGGWNAACWCAKLLDDRDAHAAYSVARDAAPP